MTGHIAAAYTRGHAATHIDRPLELYVVPKSRRAEVKRTEDLWLELTFYPSRGHRRATVRKIRKTEGIAASIEAVESLNSKRLGAWAIANASRQSV